MAANTNPIFGLAPDVQYNTVCGTGANTTLSGDLSGSNAYLLFTADATNGSYLEKIVFRALGTNTATVCGIWINNGSSLGTAANNTLYKEITLPATTASNVAALTDQEMPIGIALPAGYKIYLLFRTATAAGFSATGVGCKY